MNAHDASHKLWKFGKKISQGIGTFICRNFGKIKVFGPHTPPLHRLGWNSAWRSRSSVDSYTPNFTPIGATRRLWGAKYLEIAPWVTEYWIVRAILPVNEETVRMIVRGVSLVWEGFVKQVSIKPTHSETVRELWMTNLVNQLRKTTWQGQEEVSQR